MTSTRSQLIQVTQARLLLRFLLLIPLVLSAMPAFAIWLLLMSAVIARSV